MHHVQLHYKTFCLKNVKYEKLWCHQTRYTNYRYNAEQKSLATGLKERILWRRWCSLCCILADSLTT